MRSNTRLGAVAAVDQLHGYAFVVLAPEIARGLHVSTNAMVTMGMARGAGFLAIAALVGAAARAGRARRVARAGAATRAGALVIGALGPLGAVTIGLGAYGAATASVPAAHNLLLAESDRERHRLAGRLGNVAVPLLVGLLALAVGWRLVFVALALVAALAFLLLCGFDARMARQTRTEVESDEVVARFAVIPGSRAVLAVVAAAGIVELPMHVALFAHLGIDLHVPVLARAGLAAAAELAGVVGNVALGRRVAEARPRSVYAMAAGLLASVVVGLVALVAAVAATTVGGALVALAVASVAISASIPVLALGTRAALAGAVPRSPAVALAAAVGGVILITAPSPAATVAILAALPLMGAFAVASMALRQPARTAAALDGVANVTPIGRMPVVPPALDQA